MISSPPILSLIIPIGPNERGWQTLLYELAAFNAKAKLLSRLELVLVACEPIAVPDQYLNQFRLNVLKTSAGRSHQQNLGAEHAKAENYWFLHADSELSEKILQQAISFIQSAESLQSVAYFKLGFAQDGPRLAQLNAVGANLRSHLFQLPFGDQGFLIAKSIWKKVGNFDTSLAAGEDLDWIVRAKLSGFKLVCLPAKIQTSARKYRDNGWLATTLRHLFATVRLAHESKQKFFQKKMQSQ